MGQELIGDGQEPGEAASRDERERTGRQQGAAVADPTLPQPDPAARIGLQKYRATHR